MHCKFQFHQNHGTNKSISESLQRVSLDTISSNHRQFAGQTSDIATLRHERRVYIQQTSSVEGVPTRKVSLVNYRYFCPSLLLFCVDLDQVSVLFLSAVLFIFL